MYLTVTMRWSVSAWVTIGEVMISAGVIAVELGLRIIKYKMPGYQEQVS